MTTPREPTEEGKALTELFDETADEPADVVVHRLRDHAEQVAREGGRERWLTSWVVAPLAIAAGVAAVYLVIAPSKPAPEAVAPTPPSATARAPTPPPAATEATEATDDEEDPADVFAVLDEPPTGDPFDLGLLMDDAP